MEPKIRNIKLSLFRILPVLLNATCIFPNFDNLFCISPMIGVVASWTIWDTCCGNGALHSAWQQLCYIIYYIYYTYIIYHIYYIYIMYYIWDTCRGNGALHSPCLAAVVLYYILYILYIYYVLYIIYIYIYIYLMDFI